MRSLYEKKVDEEFFTRPYETTLSTGKEVPTCFLTVSEVSELTGMSIPTVRKLFHQRSFPAVRFGKSMVVEIHAFMQYFSIPHTKFED